MIRLYVKPPYLAARVAVFVPTSEHATSAAREYLASTSEAFEPGTQLVAVETDEGGMAPIVWVFGIKVPDRPQYILVGEDGVEA
jgi:hypothetical protein